ncbi:OmpA family protein [Thalassomonas haliotis]|uniref:OmpA family protein n=1 Tax=Thalassomonas haliotis TaxID=485448 RepID=A0ABY7VEV8_9GAMM|nr:OmpA family protein [Thalassomonas haliotis]WDE12228.1 OmpA family protein [Thalassomonas haliotis]
MKIVNITLLAALISTPLAAETLDETWQVGVFGDYIKSSTNKENKNSWQQIEAGKSVGVDLHKIINDYWNVRFELARSRYDIENGNDKTYGYRYGADAVYKLPESNLYLFSGIKRFNNTRSYNALNVGAGYGFQVNDRFSVYTEAAIYKDVNYGYVDQGFKLGLKYSFGAEQQRPVSNRADNSAKPAIQPVAVTEAAPVDSDSDGISDDKDRCAHTPATVKVDSTGCTLYAEHEVAITLKVAFANNSAKVKPALIDDIQRLADFMKEYSDTQVVIEGHSSATGAAPYNLVLSQKRAEAVKDILINKFNIKASRLSAKGYGQTQLLSSGTSAEDHSLNRRVVAKIATTAKKVVQKG